MVEGTKTYLTEKISEDVQNELIDMLPVFLKTMNLLKMVGDTMTEESIVSLTQKAERSADLLNFLGDERISALLTVLVEKSDQIIDLVGVLDRQVALEKMVRLTACSNLPKLLGSLLMH